MNKKEKPTWRLDLTEEQYNCIIKGMEFYGRMIAGQLVELNHLTPTSYKLAWEDLDKIKSICFPELALHQSYAWNGFDCKDEYQRQQIAQSYQIYREMEHQMVLRKGINNVYSSPTLKTDLADPPIIKQLK